LSYGFFHTVGQVGNLIFGSLFQAENSVSELAMSGFQVSHKVSLVAVEFLFKPLNEWGAIAGGTIADRTLR
jgi:hypothetical protein